MKISVHAHLGTAAHAHDRFHSFTVPFNPKELDTFTPVAVIEIRDGEDRVCEKQMLTYRKDGRHIRLQLLQLETPRYEGTELALPT